MTEKNQSRFDTILLWVKQRWVSIVAIALALTLIGQTIYYSNLMNELYDQYYELYNKQYDSLASLALPRDDSYAIRQRKGDGNHYYSMLNGDEKAMYRMVYKLVQEYLDGEREVTRESDKYILARLDGDEYPTVEPGALQVKYAFVYDNPSFLLGGGQLLELDAEYVTYKDENGIVRGKLYYTVSLLPEYIELLKDISPIQAAIDNSVSELSDSINENDSDMVKYVKIYEYVINNTKYLRDYKSEGIIDEYTTNIIGVLDGKENTGSVCQGYALTMTYLCNIFYVDCIYVASTKISHAFNFVCIDGVWYYSDTTNGDADYTYTACFLGGEDEYWSLWGYDEPYVLDLWSLSSLTVSKINYPIGEDTYVGNLKFK